jgi:GxxExxY protein
MLTENEIATKIVDAAYHVHVRLGPGLLESVYQAVLVHELRKRNLFVAAEVPIMVHYDDLELEVGFKADIIVDDKVTVELKSIEQIAAVHKKQLLTCLRLADKRLGLLMNFGDVLIKNGITRIVNSLPEYRSLRS